MAKKEPVQIVRSSDFVDVDEELNAAMAGLEEVNSRIEDLLEGNLDFGEAYKEVTEGEESAESEQKKIHVKEEVDSEDSDSSDSSDSDSDDSDSSDSSDSDSDDEEDEDEEDEEEYDEDEDDEDGDEEE
jgi:hypothetical protein